MHNVVQGVAGDTAEALALIRMMVDVPMLSKGVGDDAEGPMLLVMLLEATSSRPNSPASDPTPSLEQRVDPTHVPAQPSYSDPNSNIATCAVAKGDVTDASIAMMLCTIREI
jgi:hypothetical protein